MLLPGCIYCDYMNACLIAKLVLKLIPIRDFQSLHVVLDSPLSSKRLVELSLSVFEFIVEQFKGTPEHKIL
jgi:hypothetical protein